MFAGDKDKKGADAAAVAGGRAVQREAAQVFAQGFEFFYPSAFYQVLFVCFRC